MKFVVYGNNIGKPGLLEQGRILDLAEAARRRGLAEEKRASFSSLHGLIELGQRGLDDVRAMAEKFRGEDEGALWVSAADTRLQAPWPQQRFLLAGSNNSHHLSAAYTNMGTPLSIEEARANGRKIIPSGFWGQARPIMGPNDEIAIPERANGYFDFEGEPAIILGKAGKNVRADQIADFIWGVTLVCDWSIRVPQWPPQPNPPFMPVKNFDNSKSVGPCIVVDELDADNFQLQTLVNGELRQDFNSNEMIYSFGEILEFFSRDFTYFPGDVISGGTGAGTAIDQVVPNADGSWPTDLFLKDGDTVEVRSERIGSLVNQVVALK